MQGPESKLTEENIIRRLQKGKEEAAEDLYLLYFDRFYETFFKVARGGFRSHEYANQTAIDAIMRIIRYRNRYRGGNARSWFWREFRRAFYSNAEQFSKTYLIKMEDQNEIYWQHKMVDIEAMGYPESHVVIIEDNDPYVDPEVMAPLNEITTDVWMTMGKLPAEAQRAIIFWVYDQRSGPPSQRCLNAIDLLRRMLARKYPELAERRADTRNAGGS